MGVRNTKEVGLSLQKIIKRLMSNDNLVNLLYYEDEDPLSHPHLTEKQKKELIFNKLIKIVPRIGPKEDEKSFVSVTVVEGDKIPDNTEFQQIGILTEIFVPLTAWLIKDVNLRPFAILGEIQESLDGKNITGMGTLKAGSFEINFLTEEVGSYKQMYWVTK